MITFITFLGVLSILIVVHEFGHFIMAKKMGVRVEKFSLGFGPKLFSKKGKDTEYTICAIPLGGYVKLAGDSLEEYKGNPDEYYTKSTGKRFNIVFFGPLLNYALGILCFWLIFVIGYPKLSSTVGEVMDGFGAKSAGLVAGDKITAVDGKSIKYWDDLQKIIQSKKSDTKIKISYLRKSKEYQADVPIKEKAFNDLIGKKRSIGIIGIVPSDETIIVRSGIFKSLFLSVERTWDITVITYEAIWRMITGKLSMRESVTGPLGMYYITSKVVSLGFTAIIHFLATISISLCLFNLLPIPALDGGHILLLLIEKIRGKNLSFKTEEVISKVGFTLLISLALFVTYNDILRLFGDKIMKLFK